VDQATTEPGRNGDLRAERSDAALAAEIERLRTERSLLIERLASAERLAAERDQRLSDLRLALFMVPKPNLDRGRSPSPSWPERAAERRPDRPIDRPPRGRRPDGPAVAPAIVPGSAIPVPGIDSSVQLRDAMLAATEQLSVDPEALGGNGGGEPGTHGPGFWTREAERLRSRDGDGVWETFDDLPPPPWWMRLRWRLRQRPKP
jgi:hypothetical protein